MPSPTRRRSSRSPARRRRRWCSCTSTTPSAPPCRSGIGAMMPKFNMPYKIVETDRLRSGRARPFGRGGQGQGDRRRRAAGGEPAQRRDPDHARTGQAALVADGACSAWGRAGTRISISRRSASCPTVRSASCLGTTPTRSSPRCWRRRSPRRIPGVNLNTNHIYTFEALLVAADAYKRAESTDPKALADAIRTTNITNNVSIGPGIQFNAKGQNEKVKNAAIQNRGGKLVTVAPKGAADAKPQWPMAPTTSAER